MSCPAAQGIGKGGLQQEGHLPWQPDLIICTAKYSLTCYKLPRTTTIAHPVPEFSFPFSGTLRLYFVIFFRHKHSTSTTPFLVIGFLALNNCNL